ncbi:MAG: DNA repair exonuclease [Pyrinomonadaceae bacterium]|nr:DNA repair exonuclease [Pyrinomonadaceae bacterium]
MKFLHISDVHLGCTRYQLAESPKDFFRAWHDVITKYAIGEKVDFVIIGGDFFHKRNVDPQGMNHAYYVLDLLKKHGIPAVAIEGNHDQHSNESDHSWLRSLASWGLLVLLEPKAEDGKINYRAWDKDEKDGSFIDIGNARIFGSQWYGASANVAIPKLTESIKENQRDGAFHILLLHTDVEGHQTHPIPALSIANLKELKSVTQYVALGHTHKSYEIDNWAFNPGSLEVTNIDEFREIRGAYLVEISEDLEIMAQHVRDYQQRPFARIQYDVDGKIDAQEITTGVLAKVRNQIDEYDPEKPQPIIEITLRGHLGFPNSLLEMNKIREETQKSTNALHVRIKNHTAPVEYAVAADLEEDVSREKLERRVIEDLIVRDNRYKLRAIEMAEAVVGAKKMALGDESPEKIVDFIAVKLEDSTKLAKNV